MRIAHPDPGSEVLEGIALHQIRRHEHGGGASNASQTVGHDCLAGSRAVKSVSVKAYTWSRLGGAISSTGTWKTSKSLQNLWMIQRLFQQRNQHGNVVLLEEGDLLLPPLRTGREP